MEYGQVCLRRGEERALRGGRLRIYENEIEWVDDLCVNGEIVEVIDSREQFVAYGFFNALSKITVRILSFDKNALFDRVFFRSKIQAAWDFRLSLGFENACRVIFGESDGLPGLTVDKYGDYLSFQIVSLGMEQWKEALISIFVEIFAPKGIYERNDLAVRSKEGMPMMSGCVYGEVPETVEIREHDAIMRVNIADGQKTGHFLDQQENRGRIRPYVKDRSVLDLCCCTGGFSVHAALYGAKSVEAVDVSGEALRLTMENARLNGVTDRIVPTEANVFDLARAYAEEGRQYGCVICDPPAFAKSRRALEGAWRGYKELNLRCMKMVAPGGFLISCSCSQFMTPELFLQMLQEASQDANRPVRLLEALVQSRDHPACLGAEQSLYLKGYILQVL
ncbi:MAG: class I SAM-dependent rRNA methyltransferase [Ruminococcaceae bacterium]|nr:class I SAM-dependent rRNA methyltransferase [Oscillospiraceae bacterium]